MTYDIVQTTFLLSMASNGASGIKDYQSNLQQYLEIYLNGGTDPTGTQFEGFFPFMNSQLAGGDWSVVWGPCLYSVNGDKEKGEATNAMYVAYSPTLSTYVVAIAATNFKSIADWLSEDFDVSANYMAKWPLTVPFEKTWHLPWVFDVPPAISAATALGVSNLLTQLTDSKSGSLQQFLSKTANTKDTLIFCGHSLAGALSPTLALCVCPNPSQSGWKNVYVLPTAGASPGNTHFAALFNGAYPPTASGVNAPYGNWNTDYANGNDAVPHAWNQLNAVISPADGQGNYQSMYGVIAPQLGKDLYETVKGFELSASGGFYANITQSVYQFNQPGQPDHPNWGQWVWSQNADGSWQYPPVWQELTEFTEENTLSTDDQLKTMILATHVDQYYKFFNVVPSPRMPSPPPKPTVPTDGADA